jgi:hypothetical protein
MSRPNGWALFVLGAAMCRAAMPCLAQETDLYEAAGVDSTGQLSIRTSTRQTIRPPDDSGQVGIDHVAVSPDRTAVGWLVLHRNCCTSYPIPLTLKVYVRGTVYSFSGINLPIWRWRFEDGGERVAFYQETVHGGLGRHYELREVRTGRLVGHYEPTDSVPAPAWVHRLTAMQVDSGR